MNIQEALLRNRRIFEMLTGEKAADEGGGGKTAKRIDASDFAVDEPQRRPLTLPEPENEANELGKVFSLKSAGGEASFSLGLPESIAYPEISEKKQSVGADPLEELYYRLEVDARRASQLLGEEE